MDQSRHFLIDSGAQVDSLTADVFDELLERDPSRLSGHYFDSAKNTFTAPSSSAAAANGTTLGMNWYLNAHTKWQFNWIHAFLNNTAKGFSQADLFVTRIQVDF
jgi:phosphate-selective porin OprO/OprP